MRNAVAAMLAVAMLITSALIALEIAVLMRTPIQIGAPNAAGATVADHEPLLRAFYDAANALLAGERSTLLATVISPEIQTHDGSNATARGEDGLRDYLAGLGQRGDISFHVVQVIGDDAEIAVVVETRQTPSRRWRGVDLFRLEAGVIADYWPSSLNTPLPFSLPSITVPAPDAAMGVSLTRLELAPAAEPVSLAVPVPHLLLVETGAINVSREHALQIARAGVSRFAFMAADPAAEHLLLRPGDAILVPEAASPRVWNAGTSSASALSLIVDSRARLFGQLRAGPSSLVTMEIMHDGWRVGRKTAWDGGAVTETLAVKHLPVGQYPKGIEITSNQFALDPGQRSSPLPPGALRLAIVRAGVVGVSVINSDAVPISVPNPDSLLAAAANHLFWAGDAFWIEASEAPHLANAGAAPLDILLIDVVPLKEQGEGTPTSYATEPLDT